MITPIITSLCREVFSTVPTADRHAAYALGATRWEMIRAAVLPRSRARHRRRDHAGSGPSLGETIAVALLDRIGRQDRRLHRSSPGYTMAAVIANTFAEATGDHIQGAGRHRRGALRHDHHHQHGRPRHRVAVQPDMSGEPSTRRRARRAGASGPSRPLGGRQARGRASPARLPARPRAGVWRNRRNTALIVPGGRC